LAGLARPVANATSALSGDTKDALAREPVAAAHCRVALRDALVRYGAPPGGHVFRTQRLAVARLALDLFDRGKPHAIRKVAGSRVVRVPTYEIELATDRVDPAVARRAPARCDRRMELRGAFLACGSLASPARGYHVEFVPPGDAATDRLVELLRAEDLEPKVAPRKGRRVVYFKGVDAITAVLATIGASRALLHLEDIRALKETKNRIHRLVNTEAANVDRATRAAAAQRAAIARVVGHDGMRRLSKPLREAAELRLAHPTETLGELGRRASPPAKKSTMNGRIAALLRIASGLTPEA